jgi:hypothetical protein
LDIIGVAPNDQSGYSNAMSDDGKTIAIGATFSPNGYLAGQQSHLHDVQQKLQQKSQQRLKLILQQKNPTKIPTTKPTKVSTKLPTKVPTKLLTQAPTDIPTSAPTNCGIFGCNFFCPHRDECGFWRRVLHLHGC